MNDEELTRLAAQELIREAKKFMERRDAEFRATQMKQPMKANKRFLNNTIQNVMSFNNNYRKFRRVDKKRKMQVEPTEQSSASEPKKCLKNEK